MYTITQKQMAGELVACIEAGLTPYVTSSPGMGKSSICADVAEMGRLKLIDLRLAQCTPEDLQGFPMRIDVLDEDGKTIGQKASFTPFDMFPLEGEEPPEGYDGWLLLLDELSSANKQVQAAAYKLILDRMVGSYHLHPACAIVAAGNKITDKAVVNQMSTALQSRLIHYELEISNQDWHEWAVEKGVDHRILGYLHYSPTKLMDFNPDHNDRTFPCPRTWDFLNRLVKGKPVDNSIGPRIAGTVGNGVAVEFITFAKEYERLPKMRDIVADPEGTTVPTEGSTRFAVVTMLMSNFTKDNLSEVIRYMKRFPMEFQIIFCRAAVIRDKKARTEHKDFSKYVLDMVEYLA